MLAKKPFNIKPQSLYLLIMLIQLIVLLIMLIPVFDPLVFLLFLFVTFSMVLRWRVNIRPVYMLIDEIIFIIISVFYPLAAIYLFLFAYYFSYKNKLVYIIPIVIMGAVLNQDMYYLLVFQAILFGTILHHWSKDNAYNKELTDHLRHQIYNLEFIQAQLLSDYQDTEKISRLTERHRIAEILHDNLGHELTAAHLSLKAYKTLMSNKGHKNSEVTLNKAEQRLESALQQLKDSVKQIEPNLEVGFIQLQQLCDSFIYPIQFTHSGNNLELKPYIWQLVLMSVKEALTNITKHAHPKVIKLSFDVTDYVVRLMIENDGIINNTGKIKGHGLRYMRNRLEAVNGSLSVQNESTFKLIIIISTQKGR
jgi:signal transduction histidine kinase